MSGEVRRNLLRRLVDHRHRRGFPQVVVILDADGIRLLATPKDADEDHEDIALKHVPRQTQNGHATLSLKSAAVLATKLKRGNDAHRVRSGRREVAVLAGPRRPFGRLGRTLRRNRAPARLAGMLDGQTGRRRQSPGTRDLEHDPVTGHGRDVNLRAPLLRGADDHQTPVPADFRQREPVDLAVVGAIPVADFSSPDHAATDNRTTDLDITHGVSRSVFAVRTRHHGHKPIRRIEVAARPLRVGADVSLEAGTKSFRHRKLRHGEVDLRVRERVSFRRRVRRAAHVLPDGLRVCNRS